MSFLTNVVKVLEALGIKNKVFNDKRYVNTTGDTMTGGLTIKPATNTLTALVVNDKDANNVLKVETINNAVLINNPTLSGELSTTYNKLIVNGRIVAVDPSTSNGLEFRYLSPRSGMLAFNRTTGAYLPASLEGLTVDLYTSGTSKLTVNNGGNVGIGTTTPTAKLQINSIDSYESATLGSELLSASNWTLGTGWTGDFSSGFAHTTGSVETLTNTLAAVVNNYYQIDYTVTGRTTGSFTVAFGGQSKSGITTTGAFGPRATDTTSLIITPTSDFNGTIVLSIKTIGTYSPTFALYDSTNASNFEIRSSLASLTNTFIGKNAGRRNTTGSYNSAQGMYALQNNTTGNSNSAQGMNALYSNTTGYNNSAQGTAALQNNTTGYNNSAQGYAALYLNTTGYNNSAQGVQALYSNTTGYNNSAQGYAALYLNTTGSSNSAQGVNALFYNTTGYNNSAQGYAALQYNTTGSDNSAQGTAALYSNTTGSNNSAQGGYALRYNTTGNYNSAQGVYALYNLTGAHSNNTALGYNSGRYYNGTTGNLTAIDNSILLGASASALNGTGDTNEIVIGYDAIGLGSNTIKLGNTSITNVASNGDFEALDIGDGFILKSPDGTRYRITVANGGALSAVAV